MCAVDEAPATITSYIRGCIPLPLVVAARLPHREEQMKSTHALWTITLSILAIAVVVLVYTPTSIAQQTSETSVTQGQSEQQATVERGEVVYVSGNELVVKKTDTGEVLALTVPDSARATVDGKELSVHELKPGMKLQRTITTTTTPKTVTTVTTIKGKVWHVTPPTSVILSMDGTNKEYKIPAGQKFNIDGEELDAFHLKKGMNVTATVIREAPETQIAEQKSVTGHVPTPPMEGALLIEGPITPAAAPATAAPATEVAKAEQPSKLPQTGSMLPLLGLLGLLMSGVPIGMKCFYRR
jgi:hypothetical protein